MRPAWYFDEFISLTRTVDVLVQFDIGKMKTHTSDLETAAKMKFIECVGGILFSDIKTKKLTVYFDNDEAYAWYLLRWKRA